MHYVSLSTGNVLDMYKAIAWELGLGGERSRASAHHAIRIEVSRLAQEARQLPILVVDETHHLRNDALEDLRLAGCELPLFEPPAVEALCQGARGLPRHTNRIAHYALCAAAALDNARTVNADHLQHALEALRP